MSHHNPRILIQTELGNIAIELYLQQAPITVNNFLRYIAKNRFMNSSFYRVVRMDNQPGDRIKIAVIQGGLRIDNHPQSLPPIPHETTKQTGLFHEDGTILMARNQPGTASSEFFICVGDQPELDFGGKRNPDGAGFAAFGKVLKGMDVVRKIHQSPARGQTLQPNIPIIKMYTI
jgi:peptidyl-prolyl cis-trans isomerase A (cyclophilin A)